MHTGRPAHPRARQRLAASPRGRPWRRSRFGRGGERPQGHRCPVRARGRARFHTLVPAPSGVAPLELIPAGRLVQPLLRGGGAPGLRPAGRRAVRHRRARPGRGRHGSPLAFPHGTAGSGATLRGGCPGCAHPNPPRCPHWASKHPGRSRPRPGDPDRHRRSGGRGTTPSRPATCGALDPHAHAAFPCTSTPMAFSHLWIGNGHADPGSKNGLQSRRQTRHRNNRRSMALDLKKG